MKAKDWWSDRLEILRSKGLLRELRDLEMQSATRGLLRGREVDVFSSNDSLGLAMQPEMLAAWRGGGAGSSRLIAGHRPTHAALEACLEEHFGRPALVFSSGYQANLAVMSTLLGGDMQVGSDALNHASIIDGLRLSKAQVHILPHLSFQSGLDAHVCEGLYSMDGDTPVFSKKKDGLLVVDEAHAVGCVGPGGRGVAADQGVMPDILIGTFSKAYGAAGAFVVAPEEAKSLLVSVGRSFVYTTALADAAARAALCGFRLADDERRERLAENVLRFRSGVKQLGLPSRGVHHIVPIVLGGRTMELSQRLLDRGIFVPGIRAPTVPEGEERLRFSISAAHDADAIDRALEALEECC